MRRIAFLLSTLFASVQMGHAAGRLEIEHAWVRTAPPGATMLAAYASLHNSGDAPLVVSAARGEDFGDVSLHQSIEENGVVRMRALDRLEIAPGQSVEFAPNGRHLMLMDARRELKAGDTTKISLITASGATATASFVVRDDAPGH